MSTPSNRTGALTKAEGSRPGERAGEVSQRTERKSDRPSMRPGGPESLVGVVISGRYLIERLIGEGGMGTVYQAEHKHMRKRLAVKVLHPEMSRLSEVVARFEREAMAAAHIEHPNVAAATDFGKLDDGSFFLVLEYVEGKSLREAIAEGRLELGRAIHIVRQIASALGRAHQIGIVHRDLKPENIMLVNREGDPDFVKVLDFGIAKVPVGEISGEPKVPGQALTQLGMVYGTPEYMAPEQALGQPVDPRADLYALGVMAFEMVVGARPFEHESKVTLLGMHVTAPIPRMADRAPDANVPPELDAIVTRLLAKEAGARFADARELLDALDAVVAQLLAGGRIAEPIAPMSLAQRAGAPRPSLVSASDVSGPNSAVAFGATSLANPVLQQARSQNLVSLVGASLTNALRGAPPWMTPRLVLITGSAMAALVLVVFVVFVASAVHGGTSPAASTSASGSGQTDVTPPTPPRPPDPKTDEVVAAAHAKIDKGDFATAIDELTVVEQKDPGRADVHLLLERAYTGVKDTKSAMREASLTLSNDASAGKDLKLLEDVRNAALTSMSDEAFALLESKMGSDGVDVLYDVGYGNAGKLYGQAATRARHSLDLASVRKLASPALAVLLDFRDTKTCEQKHDMLDRVRDKADPRMIPILKQYQATSGCGFLNTRDCYPCMHRDHDLNDAITAIQDRQKALGIP
jgi:serine/threonine protein kinase